MDQGFNLPFSSAGIDDVTFGMPTFADGWKGLIIVGSSQKALRNPADGGRILLHVKCQMDPANVDAGKDHVISLNLWHADPQVKARAEAELATIMRAMNNGQDFQLQNTSMLYNKPFMAKASTQTPAPTPQYPNPTPQTNWRGYDTVNGKWQSEAKPGGAAQGNGGGFAAPQQQGGFAAAAAGGGFGQPQQQQNGGNGGFNPNPQANGFGAPQGQNGGFQPQQQQPQQQNNGFNQQPDPNAGQNNGNNGGGWGSNAPNGQGAPNQNGAPNGGGWGNANGGNVQTQSPSNQGGFGQPQQQGNNQPQQQGGWAPQGNNNGGNAPAAPWGNNG